MPGPGYWQEDAHEEAAEAASRVVDLAFRIDCRELPVDHAHALHEALLRQLPWLAGEALAGLHLIHGAESGNGWQRPEAPGAVLQLSRRTRLTLRLPRARVEQARSLTGTTLRVGTSRIGVGEAAVKPLCRLDTLFARHVSFGAHAEEAGFLEQAAAQLAGLQVRAPRMLSGRTRELKLPGGSLRTRSLMLSGLRPDDAVCLQEQGLGDGRLLGCGLFVGHKSIDAVAGARRRD